MRYPIWEQLCCIVVANSIYSYQSPQVLVKYFIYCMHIYIHTAALISHSFGKWFFFDDLLKFRWLAMFNCQRLISISNCIHIRGYDMILLVLSNGYIMFPALRSFGCGLLIRLCFDVKRGYDVSNCPETFEPGEVCEARKKNNWRFKGKINPCGYPLVI